MSVDRAMQDKKDKKEKSVETRDNDPGEPACLVLGNDQTRQVWERGYSLLPGICRPFAASTQPPLLVFFSREDTAVSVPSSPFQQRSCAARIRQLPCWVCKGLTHQQVGDWGDCRADMSVLASSASSGRSISLGSTDLPLSFVSRHSPGSSVP